MKIENAGDWVKVDSQGEFYRGAFRAYIQTSGYGCGLTGEQVRQLIEALEPYAAPPTPSADQYRIIYSDGFKGAWRSWDDCLCQVRKGNMPPAIRVEMRRTP